MGCLKQLLPWGDSTVVAAAFDALQPYCGARMVVVVGEEANLITSALGVRVFRSTISDSDAEQFQSVCIGLQCAVKFPSIQRVLLHPAERASGLRSYWKTHPDEVQRSEFSNAPELVMDLDTPEDYAAAQERVYKG